MKLLVPFVLLLASQGLDLDKVKNDLKSIKTAQQAEAYLSKSGLKGRLLELDEIRDSSAAAMKLFKAKTGEIIEQASTDKSITYLYKALTVDESEVDRAQYIFFDNSRVKKPRIDSLRAVVMKKLKAGETFTALAKQYSMDSNTAKRGGDPGWYEREKFAKGFVTAVRSRAKGDVFLVDLPSEKWYYVVRKSHDALVRKKIKAVYVAVPAK
jgi:parvulin-like peptidyl-prolyl isomerase